MSNLQPFVKIVCEGKKTEPNYFNAWLRSEGYKLSNPAFKPKDHSTLGVVKEAKKCYTEAKKLGIPPNLIHVWAVFDRDDHTGIPEAFDMLKNAPIRIAFSNICFEFWLLLHFEYTTKSFQNCDAVEQYICMHHSEDYENFHKLKERILMAVKHAKKLEAYWEFDIRPIWDRNPYTNVHQIIETLGT